MAGSWFPRGFVPISTISVLLSGSTVHLPHSGSHRFIYLNAWPLVGGSVWEGLGDCWKNCVAVFVFEVSKTHMFFN